MSKHYRIIFALVPHPIFGYVVEANRIRILDSGQWSVEIKKIIDFSSQFLNFELNDIEKELLEMTQFLREEIVYDQFHLLREKKKNLNNTYFSDKVLTKEIIPYVSKKTACIIEKIIDNNVPLYYKGENNGIIGEEPLYVEAATAEPRFEFNLTTSDFRYTLTVFHNNIQLSLSDAIIISQIPCYFKVGNSLYYLPEDFDGQLLRPFLKFETISIPKNKLKEYLQTFVSKIIKKYRAEVRGFSVHETYPELNPSIHISRLSRKTPVIELSFNYDTENFSAFASQDFSLKLSSADNGITFTKVYRNKEAELVLMQNIESFGFRMIQPGIFTCGMCNHEENPITVAHLIHEISKKSKLLRGLGVHFDITSENKRYIFEEPRLTTTISNKNDWFDLQMNVHFNGITVPFQKIIPNIIKDEPEFTLPDGTTIILPEEWFSKFKDISVLSEHNDTGLKLQKAQVHLVESLAGSDNEHITDKLRSLICKNIPKMQPPEILNAHLRDYQQKGFEWLTYMYECGLGGCLADDMGLGKTIQILTYFLGISESRHTENGLNCNLQEKQNNHQLSLFEEKTKKRKKHTHLIVAPLSLLHNWEKEIVKFAPSLTSIVYTGSDRYRLYHDFQYADIILTSYGIIRNDADILKHFDFHTIVLDESQFIKNPDSKSYDALLLLSSKQRFVLTGTPLENSLTDIWTQMNFLNPRMLGSLKTFKDTYVIPVEKNNDEETSQRIQKLIGSFILRRTKSEVTPELPVLTEKICYCTMTDDQKKIYEQKKSEIRNFLIENSCNFQRSRRNIIVLSGLMKLRLIANHPRLTDLEYAGDSGKYEEICQHIEKVISEGHKTIIFSQFIKHLNLIREHLDAQKIRYEVLTGQTSQQDRQKNIQNFMDCSDVRLFLMTLKAGGVGLNLTEADYVFVLDPWWNPASELQAINRTHRIGQDKKIFAYRFISVETIEEKIMLLQQKKSALFNNIINSAALGKLNEQELLTLFE